MTLPGIGTLDDGLVRTVAAGVVAAAAVILLLFGVLKLLRRAKPRLGTPEDVAAAAEAALAGFAVSGAVVGADGQGALAVAADGRVAAIKLAGRRLVVREIPWTRVRSTAEGIIAEVEGRFGPVTLAGVDVLDIRRLRA
ncbi:hypothetical protein [Sphingomonas sp. Leaf21]|jgi:hypothetical protein|uniref:hypothetical protein n=1 Tax=Sphingomonas sp. Leaf21 TaxID=2876550 RepID=UPI001E3114E3|nr:hypothetical protein [Sphingomonas sp. Leaf21]